MLRYLDNDARELFRFDGRWADSPQLADGTPLRDITDILDIKSGRGLTADLGFVVQGAAEGYAFNTEDTALTLDWKNPRRSVGPGNQTVKVEVFAQNASDLMGWFDVFIGAAGMTPTIRPGSKPVRGPAPQPIGTADPPA